MLNAQVLILPQPTLRMRALLEAAAGQGVSPPSLDELEDVRSLAARLMDHEVATRETYASALAIQPTALLVCREEGRIAAVTGQLFLRPEAVEQVVDGRFDALDLDPALLTREGERPCAAYVWGVAAETKTAAKAVFAGSGAMRRLYFPTLTAFTRAVTPVGRYVSLSRHGCRPLRSPDDDILVREPTAVELEQAA